MAVLLFFLFANPADAAAKMREILLKDGSIIHAEVVSLHDGIYTLRSGTLGTIKVEDSKVRSIRDMGDGKRSPVSPQNGNLSDMQKSVLGTPGVIDMIFDLQNDPEIRTILEDKEVMALILSGNVSELESNPKFTKLMNNPKIRAILDKVKN